MNDLLLYAHHFFMVLHLIGLLTLLFLSLLSRIVTSQQHLKLVSELLLKLGLLLSLLLGLLFIKPQMYGFLLCDVLYLLILMLFLQ